MEHAVLFQLKANTDGKVKDDIVQGLANLKEDCPEWVIAESAGMITYLNHTLTLRLRFEHAMSAGSLQVSEAALHELCTCSE